MRVFISSEARSRGGPADFSIDTALSAIVRPEAGFTKVRLASATFPNTQRNVTPNNCTLRFVESGDAAVLTAAVAPGQYDADTLATALAQAMTAVSSSDGQERTYTVAIPALTNRCTIACASAFSILAPSSGRLYGLNRLLGFGDGTGSATSLTGAATVNLTTPNLYIFSDLVGGQDCCFAGTVPSSSSVPQSQNTNTFAFIPASSYAFGGVAFYVPPVDHWRRLASNDISRLSFSLRSEDGSAAEIPTIALEVDIE